MSTVASFTIQHFQHKWRGIALTERAAAQSHFNDLCHALGFPTPTDVDPIGAFYAFEKGAEKLGGGKGFADVWYRERFAWEYKGRHKNLDAAYAQLVQYKDDLANPPLLVTCDLDRIEIRTNFTNTKPKRYVLPLDDLDRPDNLAILRAVWENPDALRPDRTDEEVTRDAARRFAAIAAALRSRDVAPDRAAHFLVQLLFCLFAEDVGLLPRGLFTDLLARSIAYPDRFAARIGNLLEAMRDGGDFGAHALDRFNGGLFATVDVVDLTAAELKTLAEAAKLDWARVEPAIFGTLFERSLDPGTRAQLGAHYTGKGDIARVVEPVLIAPLRRRWVTVRAEADTLKIAWEAGTTPRQRDNRRDAFARALFAFQEELAAVRVLDPACGSGNFLYVALAALKDLEQEVVTYATANGLPVMLPRVGPAQLHGLEVNGYAHELAQVVVWIGYLQWMTEHGYQVSRDPVLQPLDTIRLQDALLDRGELGQPKEAVWPAADVIIGNPPFLGGKMLRTELGDANVDDLFAVYDGRVRREADLVCYFFEKARAEIAAGRLRRAGLLATNSIRGGANRDVLDRIKQTGDLFMAWDDEPWILNGAAVRISIVGFDDGTETDRTLDGLPVAAINSDLTSGVDLSVAKRLAENAGVAFMGDTKGGPFDVPGDLARRWLSLPLNPNGRPNGDVVRPWVNGLDVTRRPRGMWIVDFGVDMPEHEAAMYEAPFEYVREYVKPERATNNREAYRRLWWLHVESRPAMRAALVGLPRFIGTARVATHRLFVWLDPATLPDSQVIVFARDDDDFFGVLHSRAHEVWSLRLGTWLGVGNDPRYTPTTCFETFPFPRPDDAQRDAIAAAAESLDDHRRRWLDPPDASPEQLKKLTLTNLYNARPSWLAHLHGDLDRAVWAAYGWDDPDPSAVPDDDLLARLLRLNAERSQASLVPVERDPR